MGYFVPGVPPLQTVGGLFVPQDIAPHTGDVFVRADATSAIFRPDGTSSYLRP
jgi:hypothetical protein